MARKLLHVKILIFVLLFLPIDMTVGTMIHGIFQNKSLVAELNTTLERSPRKRNLIHVPNDSSLFGIVKVAGMLQKQLRQNETSGDRVFTDLGMLQTAMIQETTLSENLMESSNRKIEAPMPTRFTSVTKTIDEAMHIYMIDAMMSYLDSSFVLENGIIVITDDTEFGKLSLARIVQKSSESKRHISSFRMISDTSSEEEITQILQGDLFVVDCDGKLAAKLLKIAKQVGYTGHIDGVSWIFSQRTTSTLPLSCSLPEGRYIGIQIEQEDSIAKYILDNVNKCQSWSLNDVSTKRPECEKAKHRLNKVVFVQLWTRLEEAPGKLWAPVKVESNGHHEHGNPFWPRLKVAVANTFQPWITIVDFEKTDGKEPYCGLYGRYGHRFVNRNTNLTVPICAYGLAIDIVRYLEDKHEIIGEIHVSRDGLYGGYNASSGKATGLVAEILNGDADIAVDMMEETSRRKVIEFSKPYEVAHHGIAYIKNMQKMEAGVFGPFSGLLWAVIMSVIIGLVFLIWALERFSPFGQIQKDKRSSNDNDHVFGIPESMEYIWGTFCCGEIIQEKPAATGSRVTAIFISFVFIMIVAVYSANLITSFVVVDETPLITGLHDPKIIDDNGSYRLGTQLATATTNYLTNNPDPKVRKMSERLKFYDSYQESVEALKKREIDFFFSDYLSLQTTAAMDTDCAFKVIQADSNFGGLGLSFRKGSPWKRKLNLASVAMADSGEKDRLLKFWFGSGTCHMTNEFGAIGVDHVANLFICASYGVCGCVIIMLIMFIFNKASKKCYSNSQSASSSDSPPPS